MISMLRIARWRSFATSVGGYISPTKASSPLLTGDMHTEGTILSSSPMVNRVKGMRGTLNKLTPTGQLRSDRVHDLLAHLEEKCELGLVVDAEYMYLLLPAVQETRKPELVRPIFSIVRRKKLKLNDKAMLLMIELSVGKKDFEGAHDMLLYMEEMGMIPTLQMFNAILAGHVEENDKKAVEMVLEKIRCAAVKPDSDTFSHLIRSCECEEDINKYLEQLQLAGVERTGHVYMALIHAYAKCNEFEKAKQIVKQRIPVQCKLQIESSLVTTLASFGQTLDALKWYETIKQAGQIPDSQAAFSLIKHLQSKEQLVRQLQLLEDVKDREFHLHGCLIIISCCIRHKHLSYATNLLKRLKNNEYGPLFAVIDKAFVQINETQPIDLQFGLDFLRALKEELNLSPRRDWLDCLLCVSVKARDFLRGRLILGEYQKAGLCYNTSTRFWTYKLYMVCTEQKDAQEMLKKLSQEDFHVKMMVADLMDD